MDRGAWWATQSMLLGRFSHVQFFVTLQTVARQCPLFMSFSRQEFWSGLQFPAPGDLPDPGIEPVAPAVEALSPNQWAARNSQCTRL